MLVERYHEAVFDLLNTVKNTQKEAIEKAADIVVEAVTSGKKVYLGEICHSMQMDSYYRGGGPIFYRLYKPEETELHEGDVLFLSSVSGRTKKVVDLTYDSVSKGIKVIGFTSMSYATQVDPVHPSGKKFYEMVTHVLDNCAPAAEAMLDVEGIEAKFGAASGIASDFIMWSISAYVIDKMLAKGLTPGVLKSANYPGGNEYNKEIIEKNYEKYGY